MKIPMGGFHLLLDWQKFFTGTAADAGVFPFSDSYGYGVSLDLSDSFGIEVRQRRLYNFSEQTIQDSGLRIETVDDIDIRQAQIGIKNQHFLPRFLAGNGKVAHNVRFADATLPAGDGNNLGPIHCRE